MIRCRCQAPNPCNHRHIRSRTEAAHWPPVLVNRVKRRLTASQHRKCPTSLSVSQRSGTRSNPQALSPASAMALALQNPIKMGAKAFPPRFATLLSAFSLSADATKEAFVHCIRSVSAPSLTPLYPACFVWNLSLSVPLRFDIVSINAFQAVDSAPDILSFHRH